MSLFLETLRDAAIWSALLLALPAGYCVAVLAKAGWKEVSGRWHGNGC